jgi:hypothetical protein
LQQNVWKQRSYGDYTAIVGMANDTEYAYLLALKKEQVSADNIRHHYFLVSEHYSSATSRDELSLDSAPGTRGRRFYEETGLGLFFNILSYGRDEGSQDGRHLH